MTRTEIPKEPTVEALAAVWASLRKLFDELSDEDWSTPTVLPGWDVAAVAAHIIGTEAMLMGLDAPGVEIDRTARPHVHNDMGELNEQWIVEMADSTRAELRERFDRTVTTRLEALAAMDGEAWKAETFTPVGRETYGRFMRLRVFDCWIHEQDIRDAVGRPGHEDGPAVECSLDEMASAMGYVVGKLAQAPAGARVTYALTGPASREIHVEVGERAAVVDGLNAPATVTLTMPVGTFVRLGGGRIPRENARAQVSVEGDQVLGGRLIDNGAYTI